MLQMTMRAGWTIAENGARILQCWLRASGWRNLFIPMNKQRLTNSVASKIQLLLSLEIVN